MLIGHNAQQNLLLKTLESGNIPHAWLFAGMEGIGKATLAWQFAAALLDTAPEEEGGGLFGDALPKPPPTLAFEEDASPLRLMRQNAHPDFRLITPNVAENKQDIPIEAVRDLQQFLRNTPAMAQRKVILLDSVDNLAFQGANALLKVLEEPNGNTILILISHNPAKLLPTIRSRCRLLRFQPLSLQDFQGIFPDDNSAALYAATGGSVGKARQLASENLLPLLNACQEVLKNMPNAPLSLCYSVINLLEKQKDQMPTATRLLKNQLEGWIDARLKAKMTENNPQTLQHYFTLQTKINSLFADMQQLKLEPKHVFLHIFLTLKTVS
jgi:DNA polymerase-3 subunit delta'